MSNYKNKRYLSVLIFSFAILIWSQREIILYNTEIGYRVLECLYTICMTIVFTKVICFLFLEEDDADNKETFKYYFILFVLQLIAFLPLYTQSFMYGDDFWGFASDFNGDISGGLYFSRPFISFLNGFLFNTSFEKLNYFRIFNSIFLYLFGCILFRYITIKTKHRQLAFLFSAIAISSCVAVDCIAYASVYPINISLMISAISFVLYDKAHEEQGNKKIVLIIESGICLLTAFCFYQIGTPIVFVMYVISEEYSVHEKEGKRFGRAFLHLIYYGIIAITYLLLNKVLQQITGVVNGQSARGQIINSVDQIVGKIYWFGTDVCPQALTKIVEVILGNGVFKENNMFYHSTYVNGNIGTIVTVLLAICVLFFLALGINRKRSFVYGFILLMAIPLTFYPFLILPESVFLTYYAIPIIMLFIWYVLGALRNICQINIVKRIKKNVILGIIVFIMALNSNSYAENAWVNYCRDSYEYLANYIAAELVNRGNEIDTIAVEGSISPYVGGRDYVIFCVKNILSEMNYDPNLYNIVQSDNGYYLLSFGDEEVAYMEEILGEEKFEKLLNYYLHDDLYGRWLYNYSIQESSEKEFLKECFESTGQIVIEDSSTIVISLDGFNYRNVF